MTSRRTAIVTGASRGIGEQIARVLHRDGATVIGIDVPQAASDLVTLMKQGDLVFDELQARKEAIHRLLVNARILADELRGLARDNQTEIGPALQQVDDLLDMLIRKEGQLKATLHAVGPYSAILGNIIGTGPWFDAYVFNLATIPTGEFQPGGLG